jgi:hypothetical protein
VANDGWGMSTILSELLSREPRAVPTDDLKTLQQNLVDEGYVRPGTPVDGTWNPSWASGFARLERDAEEQSRAGQHWASAPVQSVWRFLGNTVPSAVYEATVGAAKGIVEQAPESAERLGILGGAAAGATTGAIAGGAIGAIGGPLAAVTATGGAIVGGIAGAIGGGIADLFGEDEGEEDQTGAQKLVDALSPAEEYFGTDPDQYRGPKAMWEDLGLVASAASLVSGVGMAGAAGKVGFSVLRQQGLRAALTKSGTTTPGLMVRGVSKVLPEKAATPWMDFMTAHGLRAVGSRPLFQAGSKAYTGLAAGSLGARQVAGFGQGQDRSTVEEAIGREDAGTAGTIADWTLGLVLNPTRFVPWQKGSIATGAQKALTSPLGKPLFRVGQELNDYMSSGVAMRGYVHLMSKFGSGRPGSIRDRVAQATRYLGDNSADQAKADGWLRLEFGIRARAEEIVSEAGLSYRDEGWSEAVISATHDLKLQVAKETAEATDGIGSQLARDLRDRSYSVTTTRGERFDTSLQFARYLEDLEGQGSGLDKMANFIIANRRVQQLMREGGEVRLARDETGFFGPPRPIDRIKAEGQVNFLRKQADEAEAAAAEATDFRAAEAKRLEATQLRAQADDIEFETKQLDLEGTTKAGEKWAAVPARLDTVTRGELNRLAKEHDALVEMGGLTKKAVQERRKVKVSGQGPVDDTALVNEAIDAEDALVRFEQDLFQREILPDRGVGDVGEYLRKKAEFAPLELSVPEGVRTEFEALGYKLVGHRDPTFFIDDVPDFLGKHDLGDYTRRAAFFETIGLSPFKFQDRDIVGLRYSHDQGEIRQVLEEEGIADLLPARYALQRIQGKLSRMTRTFDEGGEVKNYSQWSQRVTRQDSSGQTVKDFGLRVDRRQMSVDDIADALKLDELGLEPEKIEIVAAKVQSALKRGAAFGGETSLRNPIDAARMLGKGMRVSGLTGFSDFMRTFELGGGSLGPSLTRAPAVAGGVIGAGAGMEEGGFQGALTEGVIGAAIGTGFGKFLARSPRFAKGTYGYLPDKLHNLNMLLRYSLSPTFDISRRIEQYTLGKAKGDLPFFWNPEKYLNGRSDLGPGAFQEAMVYWDNLNGNKITQIGDDLERRLNAVGMTGFNPRKQEAAQAYLLSKRVDKNGKRVYSDDEIFELVSEIGRYGIGRVSGEKTVNFVFFPFSFQKKLLMTLGDFVTQAPARNVLIHESFRRYYEAGENPSISERMNDLVEKYAPALESLKYLNNLSQGASMGRFILSGLTDHETEAGKFAQVLGSVFVPSGAATPVAQTAGGLADAAVHLFAPVVVAGDHYGDINPIQELASELDRYLPLYRDVEKYWQGGSEQVTVAFEGSAPYAQLQEYNDSKRELRAEYEDLATGLGYASVDNFLQSNIGQTFLPEIEQRTMELGRRLPTGEKMSREFTDIEGHNEQLLFNLSEKRNRSRAENEILAVWQEINTTKDLAEMMGLSQEDALAMFASSIRERAQANRENPRFAELWDRFFAWQFGPLRQVAAGVEVA